MNCKCNWVEAILAIVIILFAFVAGSSSKWIIVIAAIILFLHAVICKKCNTCGYAIETHSMKKKRDYYSKKGRRG